LASAKLISPCGRRLRNTRDTRSPLRMRLVMAIGGEFRGRGLGLRYGIDLHGTGMRDFFFCNWLLEIMGEVMES